LSQAEEFRSNQFWSLSWVLLFPVEGGPEQGLLHFPFFFPLPKTSSLVCSSFLLFPKRERFTLFLDFFFFFFLRLQPDVDIHSQRWIGMSQKGM
jgi:hypothetical protein